ncbi:MAG: hypothetical protein F7B20_07485 [Aeropyrum sp.]|nr:hypothetical protein [Aeropyrum sp.]MCE4616231.1 hypothetical protein [Aeropyrum sp.]
MAGNFSPQEFVEEKSKILRETTSRLLAEAKSKVLEEHSKAVEKLDTLARQGVRRAAEEMKK